MDIFYISLETLRFYELGLYALLHKGLSFANGLRYTCDRLRFVYFYCDI